MLHGSVQLVGCHASGEGRADVLSNARADLESLAPASKAATNTRALALCCGRVLHVVGTGLAKGKGLGLEELWARLDPGHAALAGLFVAHHVALTVGNLDGYDLACDLLDITLARLGDHTVRLPLGWYDQDRTGQLSRMASKGATDSSANDQ